MVKVITYGTFDLLHEGHIRLLQRARALGDRLIVGVTADGFDLSRGKINVQQSLMERIENVRSTGLADEILIEEYEGQKIDDIQRLGIDIFTVGSDWEGEFDYLNAYCRVIYLPRTEGVSSSQLRASRREVAIGLVGENAILNKFAAESGYVNGVRISGICARDRRRLSPQLKALPAMELSALLNASDAVYIASHPSRHVEHVRAALEAGRHVLCEAPLAPSGPECRELFDLARSRGLILTEGNKTAYSTAYARLLLLVKSGKIGRVVSVDATCTSLRPEADQPLSWSSLAAFGPAALLPVVQLLGHEYTDCRAISLTARPGYDLFTRLDVRYPGAVATVKVGKGVKSEGELIITGTEGYAWVPAPWWKTDYFELRYENPADNRRYFYQLDGEGLRCQIVAFLRAIETGKPPAQLPGQLTQTLCTLLSTPAEEL